VICKTHFSDGDYVKLGRDFPISVESVDIVYFECDLFPSRENIIRSRTGFGTIKNGSRFPSRTLQEAP